MQHSKKLQRWCGVVGVVAASLVGAPNASATTPVTGTVVGEGVFTAYGLTTVPAGTTPDLSNWTSWPGRSWELRSTTRVGPCVSNRPPSTHDSYLYSPIGCSFGASGSMAGWCDLSKGQGNGGYGSPSGSGEFVSVRFSGVGTTLTVTGQIRSYFYDYTNGNEEAGGTFTGRITFLGTQSLPVGQCHTPTGLQGPVPVLVEFDYVLN